MFIPTEMNVCSSSCRTMTLYRSINFLVLLLYLTTVIDGYMMTFSQRIRPSSSWTPVVRTSSLQAHLITFDLDDTLFPVGPVIQYANNALFNHLNQLGYPIIEDEFLRSTKLIRTSLAEEGIVITYSELRMRAIRREMEKYSSMIDQDLVHQAYQVWEYHRHLGAERYLYHDTCDMLRQLKKDYNDIVIGAITNGKGNPLKMNSLMQFFDFCVSGEDEHVFPLRKPHKGIYKAALDEFTSIRRQRRQTKGREEIQYDDCFIWIHVGDDLANDVGASAQAGAYAIWADLDVEYDQSASKRTSSEQHQPSWSTATPSELNERRKLNEMATKHISATIRRLADIPPTVKRITSKVSNEVEWDV